MGKFRELVRRLKAGDFFRQLATVVIGIIITFGGNELIQQSARKREARHLLEMVKLELKHNTLQAGAQKEWFEYEKNGAKATRSYIDDPYTIPVDTLKRYINIQSSRVFPGTANAFEILRTSDAIRSIKDKSFLLRLFGAYNMMAACDSNAKSYSDIKIETFRKYYDSVERNMVEAVFEPTDIVRMFAHVAASSYIAQYLVETANSSWIDNLIHDFERLESELSEVAKTIDTEIN